jgi:hypothetical protein
MNATGIDDKQHRKEQGERGATRRPFWPRQSNDGARGGIDIGRLREVGRNLASQLEQHTRKRPYVLLGAATGLGFVAGSVFGSRLGQVVLAAALGYAARNLVEGDIRVDRLGENLEKLAHDRVPT